MTAHSNLVFDGAMDAPVMGRSVVIAVQPRLLADVLACALGRSDIDVHAALRCGGAIGGHFDVAVIMGTMPAGIHADIVIELPPEGATGGLVTTADGTEPAGIADLAALIETVQHYLRAV